MEHGGMVRYLTHLLHVRKAFGMTNQPSMPPLVVYVDVDDTLIRSIGNTRIPIPAAIRHVQSLFEDGATLYCWSAGGAAYAQASAEEVGLAACFTAFLPKPQVIIDDQPIHDWRRLLHVYPTTTLGTTVADCWQHLAATPCPPS